MTRFVIYIIVAVCISYMQMAGCQHQLGPLWGLLLGAVFALVLGVAAGQLATYHNNRY